MSTHNDLRGAEIGRLPTGAVPPYGAVIFDMDGVVTDTAAIHADAWKRLFDEVLTDPRANASGPQPLFDPGTDYRRYVDGRTREDGVAGFLAARGISLPRGSEQDPGGTWSVHGLAARKNALFQEALAERGVRVFPGTRALLQRLREGGVPTALVTASRNAEAMLTSAGIGDYFDVVIDGTAARRLDLAGKPDPAMFIEAARRLEVPPVRAAVVEDAVAGVQAGRRGGFGLVVGIARDGNRAQLEAAGADLVVEDVSQLDLGSLRADPWVLTYEGFDPAHEAHREALTTLANGYMGTRGAAPERHADGVHYPGTYLAGIYNRLTSTIGGREIEDEHMVNVPNWLPLDVRVEHGDWWSDGGLSIEDERRDLDLRTGVLTRRVLLSDPQGRRLNLTQRRLVSMARPHLAGLETTMVADGWDGLVTVRSGIDAGVRNANVAEYRDLDSRHLTAVTGEGVGDDVLLVCAETVTSRIRIATGARTTTTGDRAGPIRRILASTDWHAHEFSIRLTPGTPAVVDKTVAVVTSRDTAIASARQGVLDELERAPSGFDALLEEHQEAWSRLWATFQIEMAGASCEDRLVLNLHLFHLQQTLAPHTAGLDAGVPARGLHGEGYRGHVFWDELFVLPILTAHLPEVCRALLDYRWRRLPAARHAARDAGLRGAMFPWQSGSDGREETPSQLFNPRSQRWVADNSYRQRHAGLAVAYNAWQYYDATGDLAWLAEHGGELILEVARLFVSMSRYDPGEDRFHIDGVMGPDEYHDGYPDAPGSGLRDNAYTNVMAAWVCGRAIAVLRLLRGCSRDDLAARLGLEEEETTRWEQLSRRMSVPFHDGLISQFDGYDALQELDWDHYRSTYGNIGRLDLILEAEGDSTNHYKVAKQADVLMLLYLLGTTRLDALLQRLGYPIAPDALAATVDYYLARTAHGSTLSRVVHASVLAQLDTARAWTLFRDALVADLDDTQGGTTGEGVHLGAMAGTVDIVMRSFAGMRMHCEELVFEPRLPEELRALRFQLRSRGQNVDVTIEHDHLRIVGQSRHLQINVAGHREALHGAVDREFRLPSPRSAGEASRRERSKHREDASHPQRD